MSKHAAIFSFVVLCMTFAGTSAVSAAGTPSGRPSIQITNLHNGEVIHGSSITVHVAVSHFKLVKPVILPPSKWKTIPLLRGNQGHIHYVLDSMANMVLTRDVVVQTTHTWTGVNPGPHTVMAYLATSQHAKFPGTKVAEVHVMVASATAHQQRRTHQKSIGVKSMPRTGGAPSGQPVPKALLILFGLLAVLLGLRVRATSF